VSSSGAEGCLLRLFWILFGHLLLVALAGWIARRQGFSAFDLAYWVTVAALVAARYTDITRFNGTTAEGEPATLDHFRRYAAYTVLIGAVIWLGVHGWRVVWAD
jgi:hypothetical protein